MRTIEPDPNGVYLITDVRPPRRHAAQQSAAVDDAELRRLVRQAVREAVNRHVEQVMDRAATRTSTEDRIRFRATADAYGGLRFNRH